MKQSTGIEICKALYDHLSPNGFFPALTGGLLYKDGERKDCDIVIFRHRQNVEQFEMEDINSLLESFWFTEIRHFGFVTKCKMGCYEIDLFNPESKNGTDDDSYGR